MLMEEFNSIILNQIDNFDMMISIEKFKGAYSYKDTISLLDYQKTDEYKEKLKIHLFNVLVSLRNEFPNEIKQWSITNKL